MLKDKALAQLLAAAEPFVDPARPVFALFERAGRLLYASDMAAALFGPADSLSALSAGAHAALATLDDGEIEIPFGVLRIKLRRITARRETALLATTAAPARPAPPPEPEPAPAKEASAEQAASVAENAEPLRAPSRPPPRFVWQTDADGRFASVSADLATVVGAAQAELAGLDWAAAAARFGIVDADKVTAATAKRDTWSGITVLWPLPDSELARPIDLAALPVFDREHNFLGYRGFGVFREAVPHARPKPKAPPPEPRRGGAGPRARAHPTQTGRARAAGPAKRGGAGERGAAPARHRRVAPAVADAERASRLPRDRAGARRPHRGRRRGAGAAGRARGKAAHRAAARRGPACGWRGRARRARPPAARRRGPSRRQHPLRQPHAARLARPRQRRGARRGRRAQSPLRRRTGARPYRGHRREPGARALRPRGRADPTR